jgi:hypothetical protein
VQLAAFIVALVAAVAAAASAVIALAANRRATRANKLSNEANSLARQANDLSARAFDESGPLVSVFCVADSWGCDIEVRSTGRLRAIVEDVQLELRSPAKSFSGRESFGFDRLPVSLEPTEVLELHADAPDLAHESGTYRGRYEWRAGALVGGTNTWSEYVSIRHPDEPTVAEMLQDLSERSTDLVRFLNTADDPSKDQLIEKSGECETLWTELAIVRTRFGELQKRNQHQRLVTPLTQTENALREIRRRLGELEKHVETDI